VEGLILSLLDVTQRKLSEEKILQAQKLESIGTLAGGIAHDFNNILTSIMGFTSLVMADTAKDNKNYSDLTIVMQSAKRAQDLVKQILAFSRRDEQVKKPLHLTVIIKEAIKLLRATTPATIEIKQHIDADYEVIQAEPTQILQLLLNLCTNAVHAMKGKGLLSISMSNTNLSVEDVAHQPGLKPGDYMKMTVNDTGVGIDPSIAGRIFDPFYTTKGVGEGTGMGLSVAHGIVKGHGGFILVESTPEQGAEFNVYFPVYKSQESLDEAKPVKDLTGSERILLVDDEVSIANLGKLTLEQFGYQVTAKSNSTQALELFSQNPTAFDLVITDQSMPGMAGIELAAEMLKIRDNIPIILCTGYSANVCEQSAKETGIREFVMKPIAEKKLAEVIRKVLGNR